MPQPSPALPPNQASSAGDVENGITRADGRGNQCINERCHQQTHVSLVVRGSAAAHLKPRRIAHGSDVYPPTGSSKPMKLTTSSLAARRETTSLATNSSFGQPMATHVMMTSSSGMLACSRTTEDCMMP